MEGMLEHPHIELEAVYDDKRPQQRVERAQAQPESFTSIGSAQVQQSGVNTFGTLQGPGGILVCRVRNKMTTRF